MPEPSLNRDIFKDNPAEPEFSITKKKAADGTLTPAAGIVGATIHLSATDGGPAIDPSLSAPALERAGKPGQFYAQFDIPTINTLFPTYDKRRLYWVWTDPANIGSKVSDPVYAWSVRPAA